VVHLLTVQDGEGMGKRSAQAHRGGGVRDQSRMAMTRHEAWGVAHEPDGGTPGTICPKSPLLTTSLAPNTGFDLLPLMKSE
jgi:hypothetical protein